MGEVRRVIAGARLEIDHAHDELEFNLVTKGSGTIVLEGQARPLRPGTLIWLAPGRRHRLLRSPHLEMWVVVVRPELVEVPRLAKLAADPLRLLPGEELIDLDMLLRQVCQDNDDHDVYNAGVTYVVRRALRISGELAGERKPMHAAVTRALLQLREQGASLSLDELAAIAGITPSYLSRLLVEQTGRSFVEWRNRLRLERFMARWQPGAQLLNVALEAGFGSYTRFHRVFTALVGCPPGEWIKRPPAERVPMSDLVPFAAGMPAASVLSTRQSWVLMLGPAATGLRPLLQPDFLHRMMTSPRAGLSTGPRGPCLDDTLSVAQRRQFIDDIGAIDPRSAGALARLLDTHDFNGIYARLFNYYAMSSACLADAATALLIIVWLAATGCADPSIEQAHAVGRQVRHAIRGRATALKPAAAQASLTALLCHFVITYHALQATRASGDPQKAALLARAALLFGHDAFSGDLAELQLTEQGFGPS